MIGSEILKAQKLLLILSLSIISLGGYSFSPNGRAALAREATSPLLAQTPASPLPLRLNFQLPSRGAPGSTIGGATRGTDVGTDAERAVAILPQTNLGLTASDSPVIFVYLPENNAQFARLTITDAQKKELHSSILPSTQAGGILMLKIPEKLNLSVGQPYRWEFSLVGENGKALKKFTTQGWLEKVALNDRIEQARSDKVETWSAIQILAEGGLWQDTLEQLALLQLNNPEDQQIQQEWTGLLKAVGLEEIADTKVLPYVIEIQ